MKIRPFSKAPARTEKVKRNAKKSSLLTDTCPKKKVKKEKRRQAGKTEQIAEKKKQGIANNKRKSHVPTNKKSSAFALFAVNPMKTVALMNTG